MQQTATFGQWLKGRRQELDLTQERLAEEAGCSVDTVRKIEAGRRRPSRQVADIFASCLNVAPEARGAFIEWARGGPGIEAASPKSTQPVPQPGVTRSVQSHPTAYLPASLTPLIGREQEIALARSLLWRTTTRLLTLTGPPGIGKTRLALAVAATLEGDFGDGLLFVPLAPITDPDLVVPALAQALGVEETPRRPALLSLEEHLRDKQMLLVLDNFEQVVAAAPVVSALLAAAPRLNVLVTSRLPLHLRGEKVFSVPPLEVPSTGYQVARGSESPDTLYSVLGSVASAALFVDRAQDVQPHFALNAGNAQTVAAICARLEGLPLAIELAASKLRLLTPGDLLARLERRLSVLTDGPRDAPSHQQTLRAAIASSYDLLDQKGKQHFRRLGVFVGALTAEAAAAVGGAELEDLMLLVDHSLMHPERTADSDFEGMEIGLRFAMLETIREYALEELEEVGEVASVRRLHCDYYLSLAEASRDEWFGPRRREWVHRLENERYDLRAALHWARDTDTDVVMALRMTAALWQFWFQRGYMSEGEDELQATLALTDRLFPGGLHIAERATVLSTVLYAAGEFARMRGDQAARHAYCARSLETARKSGDDAASRQAVTDALRGLANVAIEEGNYALARQYTEERLAIYRDLQDERGIALSLYALGTVALNEGNYELARHNLEESLEIGRRLGMKGGATYVNLGEVARAQGDYMAARDRYEEALTIFREQGSKPGTATALVCLGHVALHEGRYVEAVDCFVEGVALSQELTNNEQMAKCLAGISEVWCAQGDPERAAQLSGAVDPIISAIGLRLDRLDRVAYDGSLETMRDMLGEEAFTAARQAGALMKLEDAVAYALSLIARVTPHMRSA